MLYYSEVINSRELENIINIPSELKNRDVELIILPTHSPVINNSNTKSMYGILKKFNNPDLIEHEKTAWLNSVVERNGNS